MENCEYNQTIDCPHYQRSCMFHSWRRMRRASHEALTKVAVQRYHPIQTKEATILVSALLESPEDREHHVQRTTASTIMSIIYDYPTLASGKDKVVQEIDRDIRLFSRALARTSVVEFFPWMIHVPKRLILCPHFLYCIHI
jgi:cytochrome P450